MHGVKKNVYNCVLFFFFFFFPSFSSSSVFFLFFSFYTRNTFRAYRCEFDWD